MFPFHYFSYLFFSSDKLNSCLFPIISFLCFQMADVSCRLLRYHSLQNLRAVFSSTPSTPSCCVIKVFIGCPFLEPVYRSSPVIFHLSHHLFLLMFEFIHVLARTCSAPIRVAPVSISRCCQYHGKTQLRFDRGMFSLRIHHFLSSLCIPFSLQFGRMCHCVSTFPHAQSAVPLLFSMTPS